MAVKPMPYTWSAERIAPSPSSLGYRLGLVLVSIAMILLPIIYVGFCLALAYGVYLYAVYGTVILGHFDRITLALYLGGIAAGCIGLVFMVKPLFIPHRVIDASVQLTREKEPRLFQFIDEVCDRVGATRPVSVRVDSRVNASAGFKDGLWGFVTNQLVLTIGLPLAQGLSVGEFGGVLAHEFGHFTQGAAMRVSFIIRSINGWFQRVIYERDYLDETLNDWAKESNFYLSATANVANAFVWVGRKLLWALMMAGHGVSAYMMRQMEYDADHYEREIAGFSNFKNTFLQMRLIGLGANDVNDHLKEVWKQGKLFDNLPLLANKLTAAIPEKTRATLRSKFEEDLSTAEWFSTHPSDYERISHAAKDQKPGLLRAGGEMAEMLFSDFEQLSQGVTLVDYERRYKLRVRTDTLIPTMGYLQTQEEKAQKVSDISEFFGCVFSERILVFPADPPVAEGTNPEAQLEEVSRFLSERVETTQAAQAQLEALFVTQAKATIAKILSQIGVKFKASDFSLPDDQAETARKVIVSSSEEFHRVEGDLSQLAIRAGEKLSLVCKLTPLKTQAKDRLTALLEFLKAVQPIHAILQKNRDGMFRGSIYLNNYQEATNKPVVEQSFNALADKYQTACLEIGRISERLKYPFPFPPGTIYPHLAAYFAPANDQPGRIGRYVHLSSIIERFNDLYKAVILEVFELLASASQEE